ncbi:hypothetical protein FN846DRAFT_991558 [Sphaerosporella brunnea]|uniref:HNH nuclease domain-containing protein n=1 Tax=Sphaerosporella brunnea TaxID=1250544 RepID=A0A5J5ENB0_9PEZI|nr:hypothetical protein FN846DRAFT_991558 [Sphaerosporella brunnea]
MSDLAPAVASPSGATQVAPGYKHRKYPKYTHFWTVQNVHVKTLAESEYRTAGFHQHSDTAFKITFKMLFKMLAMCFEIPDLEDDDLDGGIVTVLVRASDVAGEVWFFNSWCDDDVDEGEYYILQHDGSACEDDVCFRVQEWEGGTRTHVFDHSQWEEDKDWLPECCECVFLNSTPLRKEDPKRGKDGFAAIVDAKKTDKKPENKGDQEDNAVRGRARSAAGQKERAPNKSPKKKRALASRARSVAHTANNAIAGDAEARIMAAVAALGTRLEAKMDDRFEYLETKMDDLEAKMDDKFEKVNDRFCSVETYITAMACHLREEQYECTQEELDRCNNMNCQGIIPTRRTPAFRAAVEKRYPQCLLSGARNHPEDLQRLEGELTGPGLEAAHIVPIGRPDLWSEAMVTAVRASRYKCKMAQSDTYTDNNCVENGVLLRADLHRMFDRFFWSVNPKTNIVVVFVPIVELVQFHGMKVNSKQQGFPPRKVWQWHWEQCVVRCLRAGAGNPEDEYYDRKEAEAPVAVVTEKMQDMELSDPTATRQDVDSAVVAVTSLMADLEMGSADPGMALKSSSDLTDGVVTDDGGDKPVDHIQPGETKEAATVNKLVAELILDAPGNITPECGVAPNNAAAEDPDEAVYVSDASDTDSDSAPSSGPQTPEKYSSTIYSIPSMGEQCKAQIRAGITDIRYVC